MYAKCHDTAYIRCSTMLILQKQLCVMNSGLSVPSMHQQKYVET